MESYSHQTSHEGEEGQQSSITTVRSSHAETMNSQNDWPPHVMLPKHTQTPMLLKHMQTPMLLVMKVKAAHPPMLQAKGTVAHPLSRR